MSAEPLVRRLLSAEAYPHPVEHLRLVETHISWVFLTGRYAYKVKKPVNLGFLDFGTLAKRKKFCQEEVRLNRRFAPSLYLGTVPITGAAEQAVVDGTGTPTEWAVQLAQFDEEARLDRRLAANALDAADCDRLAREIASVHERLEVAAAPTAWGTAATVADTIHMNLAQLRHHRPTTATRSEILQNWVDAEITAQADHFDRRRVGGRIRQCHGDLHLANLVAHKGRFMAFDSIEFSQVLRWIDVASDVAFLAMDLESRGRSDLAAIVISSWIEAANDHQATAVLPIYLVYRAIVRSAIAAIRSSQPDADAEAAHTQSDRYLALAERLANRPASVLYATCGVSGCGKTTQARELVCTRSAIQLRSDVERKRAFGMSPTDRPPSVEATARLYSVTTTHQTYERLARLATAMLDSGASVVVDAACTKRWQRDLLTDVARTTSSPLVWIAPQLAQEDVLQRVAARHTAGLDASDATPEVVRQQWETFEPISADELAAYPHARLIHSADQLTSHPH